MPTMYNVCQKKQSSRLNELSGKSIVLASDMRVVSPGPTGFFGSGSTLDLGGNIILDGQVVKV